MSPNKLLVVFTLAYAMTVARRANGQTDKSAAVPYPAPPAVLPGNGFAQHDFLYTGEWDTRKTNATLFLIRGGRVAWTYQIPRKDEFNGQESEFSDMHRLSNGEIVFAYKTGWRKINADGKTIYDYRCPKTSDGWTECHSAQPIGNDKVLFMRNGSPSATLCLYNIKTGVMEMEHPMRTKEPVDQKSVHGQFRNVRMTKAGTYLISHMNLGKVIEYDRDWKEIWSCDAPSVWDAVRLKNGNTLISGNQHAFVREINPHGDIVWELKNGDLPDIRINSVHEATRLANGDTVICNWTAGVKKPDWPKIVQVIEVTPGKKVIWALNQWKDPDLGPASCIQLLDEPGNDEDQDLMR
ncbi:MAG TPA: hypothetical protein VH619_11935 [Verrucomicrobiae bacterium]|nr:hypothetical protein [Verrucomicrobiae bacterium]